MKRFICDFCLIVLLLLIGVSMDESTTYKNRDEQIKTFEEVLQKEENNDEFKSGVVTNQIKDNKASSFAKTVGSLIASIIRYGINILNDFFELITKI